MKKPCLKYCLKIRPVYFTRERYALIALLIVLILNATSSKGQVLNTTPVFDNGVNSEITVASTGPGKNITDLMRVSDTDRGQLLTWTILSIPTLGTVNGFPAFALSGKSAISPDTTVFYHPGAGQVGNDEFTIKVSDGINASTITIQVTLLLAEPPSDPGAVDTTTPSETSRNISIVQQWDTVRVPFGAAYEDLSLPANAGITYNNGVGEYLSISWYSSNFNGRVSGDYVILGDLLLTAGSTNDTYKKAQIIVTVLPNLQPTEIILSDSVLGAYPFVDPGFPPNVFTTNDPDDVVHTYQLIDGPGDSDNCKFSVRDGIVLLKENANPDKQTKFSIRVRSTDSNNNFIERVFIIYLIPKGTEAVKTVDVPNAFSPNGDGINDLWIVPELKDYKKVDIKVFDRSGALMFHSTNPTQGWDGRNPNGRVIAGAYYYMIKVDEINLKKQGVLIVLTN